MHLKPKLNTKPGIFKAANGGLLQTHRCYLLTIQVCNRKLTHHFMLVKVLGVYVILWIDFLHRYHLNYDTKTRGFFWKKSNNWQLPRRSETGSIKIEPSLPRAGTLSPGRRRSSLLRRQDRPPKFLATAIPGSTSCTPCAPKQDDGTSQEVYLVAVHELQHQPEMENAFVQIKLCAWASELVSVMDPRVHAIWSIAGFFFALKL